MLLSSSSVIKISSFILWAGSCLSLSLAILVGGGDGDETHNGTLKKLPENEKSLSLVGGSSTSANNDSRTSTKLDSNSTFYYEADTFLLAKGNKTNEKLDTAASRLNLTATKGFEINSGQQDEQLFAVSAGRSLAGSGRNGRMLDLDALLGDITTSQANKQLRAQITSRQSRNLAGVSASGGKRLHIQGFIPIVGLKDESQLDQENEDDTQNGASLTEQLLPAASSSAATQRQLQLANQRPKMIQPTAAMLANQQHLLKQLHNSEYPLGVGAQSSIGHATFNVQRYLNTDQRPIQPIGETAIDGTSNANKWLAQANQAVGQRAGSEQSKHNGIVDTLKKPIKKLTSSFSNSFGLNESGGLSHQQIIQQQTQQHNCLCVPFYMCKNGFINESALGHSQMVQGQQQSARYMPASAANDQLSVGDSSNLPQSHSATAASPAASYANSLVPVDERSLDRDIITAPPQPITSTQAPASSSQAMVFNSIFDNFMPYNNQSDPQMANTLSVSQVVAGTVQTTNEDDNQNTKKQDELSPVELASLLPTSTNETMLTAPVNPNEMTTLNQSSDYSQDILGRMLGLRAGSSLFGASSSQSSQATGAYGQQSSGSNACGLFRTCCSIATSALQQAQEQQVEAGQQQKAFGSLHRYPQPQQQQISRLQLPSTFGMPASNLQQLQKQQHQQQQQFASSNQLALYEHGQQTNSANLFQHKTYPQLEVRRTLASGAGVQQRPNALLSDASLTALQSGNVRQFGRANGLSLGGSVGGGPFALAQTRGGSPLNMPLQQQQQPQLPSKASFLPAASAPQMGNTLAMAPLLGSRRLLEGRCGLRLSSGINGRVQNLQYQESSAEFGEYPAQAAILKRISGNESLFVCSGTLISQSWVATAAHCIRKQQSQLQQRQSQQEPQLALKVRLGEWDVHRDDEFYPFVEKEVRDLVVHPEFVPGNLINDIALLRLDSPVDASLPHVNPACLPLVDESFARQRCWVTGWGKDSFGQRGSFQSVLQEVELPVHDRTDCEQALRKTRLGPHYRLHPGFICAGGETGKDACEGDGGSGLYCLHEGVIKVAGLVSWGIGCGQAGVPGVYVNLAQYRPWIENIISIDEDVYSGYAQLPASSPISERSNGAKVHSNETSSPSSTAVATTTATTAFEEAMPTATKAI